MTAAAGTHGDGSPVRVGASMTALILDSGDVPIAPRLAGLGAYDLDYLSIGDHVTFRSSIGIDGLLHAACVLSAQPNVPMQVGVYLLALRHPTVAARQVSDLVRIHPGRLTLAVGVGGDDRAEFLACGVDPSTRGRRTDEALDVLRALLSRAGVSYDGRYFELADVSVLPLPTEPVPILIGGRSDYALRRTARIGDGWLGMWVSARRYAEAVRSVAELAVEHGRDHTQWQHGLTLWCCVDDDAASARARLATLLESRYDMPFAKFEKWCPAGTAEYVARVLADYVEAGCRSFTLTLPGPSVDDALSGAAAIRHELRKLLPAGAISE